MMTALRHIRKPALFQKYIFFSTITVQSLFHFRGRGRHLLFNGVLFAQEISQ